MNFLLNIDKAGQLWEDCQSYGIHCARGNPEGWCATWKALVSSPLSHQHLPSIIQQSNRHHNHHGDALACTARNMERTAALDTQDLLPAVRPAHSICQSATVQLTVMGVLLPWVSFLWMRRPFSLISSISDFARALSTNSRSSSLLAFPIILRNRLRLKKRSKGAAR